MKKKNERKELKRNQKKKNGKYPFNEDIQKQPTLLMAFVWDSMQ